MKRTYLLLLSVMALFAVQCHSGHNHDSHGDHDEHEAEAHEHEEGVIHLTQRQATEADLSTEVVAPGDFEGSIRVSGQVVTAQGDEATITAKSSGIVSFAREHMSEGVSIRQGEVIARISSVSMQGGDAVAQQNATVRAAKTAYERAKTLVADSLISQKEYERLKTEYELARLSSSSASSSGGSALTSPLTGFVQSVDVKAGQFVEAGTTVATVTKSCNLQLRAELPEKYFRQLHDIRSANFVMSYGGDVHSIDSLHGHLVSVGNKATDASAYIPVTFEFVNDGCMVPGSFADIWLLTNVKANTLSVPTAAISEEQGVHYVYVMLPEDEEGVLEFEKREVHLGTSNGTRTEVLHGIASGDRVVVRGVTQVKLAGASGSVPEAHSHNH